MAPGDLGHCSAPGHRQEDPQRGRARLPDALHAQRHRTDRSLVRRPDLRQGTAEDGSQARGPSRSKCSPFPPGADNHEVSQPYDFRQGRACSSACSRTCTCAARISSIEVVYPDGKTETLLSVPHYDFGWQSIYRPGRSRCACRPARSIECTAHFDNSAKNPNNPDPIKLVIWGDQTWEEMMIGFMDYAYVDGKDAKGPPCIKSTGPSISASGVRNSWLTFEKNAVLRDPVPPAPRPAAALPHRLAVGDRRGDLAGQ